MAEQMLPIWSMQLEKASCDLGFTEAINKRMQVPSRLKVAEDPSAGDLQGATPKDCPPSYQMHIPDRILVAGREKCSGGQRCLACSGPWGHEESDTTKRLNNNNIACSRPGAPISNLVHQQVVDGWGGRRGSTESDIFVLSPCMGLCLPSCSGGWALSIAALPSGEAFPSYCIIPQQSFSLDGRLQHLEKQRMGWHQKELLFYSVLASSCLINMWLWHKR
uniref:Mitochondrial fission factor n=1 Tax=Podarcis muralis TaxID=64176 RepID=A0A670KDE4_PODMU